MGISVGLCGSSDFAIFGELVGGLGLLGSGFGVLDFPWNVGELIASFLRICVLAMARTIILRVLSSGLGQTQGVISI